MYIFKTNDTFDCDTKNNEIHITSKWDNMCSRTSEKDLHVCIWTMRAAILALLSLLVVWWKQIDSPKWTGGGLRL